jgi:hypothetical protein
LVQYILGNTTLQYACQGWLRLLFDAGAGRLRRNAARRSCRLAVLFCSSFSPSEFTSRVTAKSFV